MLINNYILPVITILESEKCRTKNLAYLSIRSGYPGKTRAKYNMKSGCVFVKHCAPSLIHKGGAPRNTKAIIPAFPCTSGPSVHCFQQFEQILSYILQGVQWLSGRVLDLRPRGCGFELHRHHCIVFLSKNINPSLVLVQPRKTRPYVTERLLMGRKESNQTNKQTKSYILPIPLGRTKRTTTHRNTSDIIVMLKPYTSVHNSSLAD